MKTPHKGGSGKRKMNPQSCLLGLHTYTVVCTSSLSNNKQINYILYNPNFMSFSNS